MASIFSTERLAHASAYHPWRTVAIWIIVLLIGGVLASRIGSVLTNEQDFTNEPESARAVRLIEDRLTGGPEPASEVVIVRSEGLTVDDPQFQTRVSQLTEQLRATEDVASATSYYETQNSVFVSEDRHTTLLPVTLNSSIVEAPDHVGPMLELIEAENGRDGFEIVTGGAGSIGESFNTTAESDLLIGEGIGISIALIILIIVFGAVVAAMAPIILALFAIIIATGATMLVGQVFALTFFVTNMITMIGLAVGIDYSLFIIQRFREERAHGLPKNEAITRAGATASRTVLFSGFAVIVALLGMFIVPTVIFRSLAIGAMLVVVAAVAAALTLLPAVLSLLGDRINRLRVPLISAGSSQEGGRFWARAASAVMARPAISAFLAITVLVAASIPYFSIKEGFAGAATFPEGIQGRRAFDILNTEFNAGLLQQEAIVVDTPDIGTRPVQDAIAALRATLATDESFGETTVVTNEAGDLAVIHVPVAGEAASTDAFNAMSRLRDTYIPAAFAGTGAEVSVGGPTSGSLDFLSMTDTYTPIVFGIVLGLSFLVLLLVFRSIVVPAKAIVMNLLSVGAAYGLLVLVFQHGVGNELLGFQQVERIEAWLPLMLFTILFGLSMDYHVFLLSRIRERYDQTYDNEGSIAFGVRSTAGIITGAALIMVAVFGGFAMGRLVMFQQMGFGLAVAVIVDASIIRVVLVPASMRLLGDWNWYLPRWLNWLPDIRVEGEALRPHEEALAQAE